MTTVSVVPVSAHLLARPSSAGTPGDFDFGDREDGLLGGDNSHAEDMFYIHGGHSEHPEDDPLGDLAKPVVRYHICVMFDELLLICAYIL
jgi:hypothetical protein